MGLPSATSVQQEKDALDGPLKSTTYDGGEKVVQEKLRQRGLARRNGNSFHVRCSILILLTCQPLSTALLMTSIPTDHSLHILQGGKFYGHGQRLALCHLQEAVWTTRGSGKRLDNAKKTLDWRTNNFASTFWLIRLKVTDSTLGFGTL